MSINGSRKQETRGRPPVDSEGVKVRIERAMLDAIDGAAGKQSDRPNRPEMLRRIAREWLTERGFLKPTPLSLDEVVAHIEKLDAKAAALKHDGTPSPANAMKTMDRALAKGRAKELRKRLVKAK